MDQLYLSKGEKNLTIINTKMYSKFLALKS